MAVLLVVGTAQPARAISVLVSDSGGTGSVGYGYANWSLFSAAIDSTAGGSQNVDVVPDLTNPSQVLSYDALLVDQRWTDGSLQASEIDNIAAFIATGRRVLLVGENDFWASWNTQIVELAGGTYAGQGPGGTASPVVANALTAGITSVDVASVGVAAPSAAGTALFDVNFATLWGDNVLTVLDTNVFADAGGADERRFANNVAIWLTFDPLPEPSTGLLVVLGIAYATGAQTLRRTRAEGRRSGS